MKKFVIIWAVNTISLWAVDAMMKSIYFADFSALLITGLVLSILNATLKPFLKMLSFPVSILTLGLFSVVINGFILYLAIALTSASGSYVSSFGMAVLASVLLSAVNAGIQLLIN
jgi:putative membrane protein